METVRTLSTDVQSRHSVRNRLAAWRDRITARLGLQGKLIVSFTALTALALSVSYSIYFSESRQVVARHAGSQAVQLAQTLAMAGETPLRRGEVAELDRITAELLENIDLAAVAFFDPNGQPLSVACRDPRITTARPGFLALPESPTQMLMRPMESSTSTLGDFAMATAPIVAHGESKLGTTIDDRLAGYVTVCLSENAQRAHLSKIQGAQMLIGLGTLVFIVPLVCWLVHRIFQPIRKLVGATDQITQGNLDARVAIDRSDVIGTLARSFNLMVQKVKAQQDNLEKTVRERTTQLESANTRLTAEIAEKEDFLRAVSHDLNAPLRNISGMAEMLLAKHGKGFDDDVIHRLQRIQKNADVERDLINELLELSRIKSARQNIEMVDVDALVRELAGMFESDLKGRGISLLIDGRLPVIQGEPSRLRQVFQNLIDNAIKYMGDGAVREIDVGAAVGPRGAEFYVRDTGLGIDPDDIDKVFHVFRRGRNAHAQQVSGKGVGLANVKSIVETYHGRIWVESTLGQGSTFRFTIHGQFVPAATTIQHSDGNNGIVDTNGNLETRLATWQSES